MLSPFQQQFLEHQKKPSKKLAPNFYKKERYMVHGRNLKFYEQQGMVIRKVHRVMTFKQEKWMEDYIQKCVQQQREELL